MIKVPLLIFLLSFLSSSQIILASDTILEPVSSEQPVSPLASQKLQAPELELSVSGDLTFKELKDLANVQKEETRRLELWQRKELQSLKASQDQIWKDWDKRQRDERYRYFDRHPKGSERRVYIQEFIARRDRFRQDLRVEWDLFIQRHKREMQELKDLQAVNQQRARHSLVQGLGFDVDLQPKPNFSDKIGPKGQIEEKSDEPKAVSTVSPPEPPNFFDEKKPTVK